ncbi:MAG: transporter substrate-binding domain-containing protein [Aquabacterium sp.]
MTETALDAARHELAPQGLLRVGLNLSNFLLVSAAPPDGEPVGIAPDLGRELAARLGVGLRFVRYANPGALAAAAAQDAWDVGLIGADPLRAAEIAFTPAYLEIEASYLVPAGSPIQTIADVDRPGVRIAVGDKTAYDMYLRRTLQHATLHRAPGLKAAFDLFVAERLDVLAGLVPALTADAPLLPGARLLPGRFTAIQQAIGTPIGNTRAAAWLRTVVDDIRAGWVAQAIARHGVQGVAPAAAVSAV